MPNRRAFAAATIALAALAPAAVAQKASPPPPQQSYEQLERTLEKFVPPTTRSYRRAPAPAPAPARKQEFEWITPDERGAPHDGSRSGWLGRLTSLFASAETRSPAPIGATRATLKAGVSERRPFRLFRGRYRAATPEVEAEAAGTVVPVAKRNSFVIQLKPTAAERDIKKLLDKYSLTVTKVIAPLGVITVEQAVAAPPVPPGAATQDQEVTRRVGNGPPAEPATEAPPEDEDAAARLQRILEPPIIQELRSEGVVDGAFVNSTLGANAMPKPSGARLVQDGVTYAWRWYPGEGEDGAWSLKAIRMPPVWRILDRHRALHPGTQRPKVGIVDGGFIENPSVPFVSTTGVRAFAVHRPGCDTHHGMHVAGIIGARHGDPSSIDGMIPDARLDAIAVDDKIVGNAPDVGVDEGWEVHALLFDDVLAKTLDYVYANLVAPDNLRVINVSLGYNFLARGLLGDKAPDDVPGLALHIHHQANLIRLMASRVENKVLFVVAAGNDSDGREKPIETKWASPFAWAGTQPSAAGPVPKNILVVEATGHDGNRAGFSNVGGHVAAPGVDIMSTLAGSIGAHGVCSGTSQAAPHASALAAILFELDPDITPERVRDLIVATASAPPAGSGGKGTIDALEAVTALSDDDLRLSADLTGDGRVDAADLALFSRQLESIENAATRNAPFIEDLNGDGAVDDNECFWPATDLNGSGFGSDALKDARRYRGEMRSDIDAIGLSWNDSAKPYQTALAEAGLGRRAETMLAAVSPTGTPKQCRGLIPVANESIATGGIGTSATGDGPANPFAATTAKPGEADPAAVRREVEAAIEALRKENPKLRVTINPATGLPTSISGLAPQPGAAGIGAGSASADPTEDETKRAVENFFGNSALSSALPTRNKQARNTYVGRRRDPDFPGRYVAEVEQRIDGVKVFGSSARLTVDRSLGVTSYKGTPSNVAIEDTLPKVAETDAVLAARDRLAEIIASSPDASRAFPLAPNPRKADATAELLVFDPALVGTRKKGATRLSWMVTIDSFRIFVDANTKEAFYYYRDQPSGVLRRIFDLEGGTAFPGKKGIDDEGRTRLEDLSPEALTAYRNAGIVRDFFFLSFGRYGYDDNDGAGPAGAAPLESYVRYGRTQNAYWCTRKSYDCPAGNVMVYGPGYSGAIDIVAHEMTHGIIAHEKNLLYLNEPGAVNEALSDIFGALIEFEAKGDAGNWLIGEAAPGFSSAAPLRSMADPNLRDENGKSLFDRKARFSLANRGQPDHYDEVLTPDDEQCGSTAYQDNGCVHFNSGILNKFAYLVAEGGTHRGVAVTGIGRTKLARIAYRAITTGLNQSSGLKEAATAFVEGCYELSEAKLGGLTDADCVAVTGAQHAVGLGVTS